MSLASRLIKAIFATEAGVLTAASSPAASDNSKKIATTEWAAFGFVILKSTPGYIKFPTWLGGLVIQWGVTSCPASSSVGVAMPLNWPNAVLFASGNVGTPITAGPWACGVSPRPSFPNEILIQNTDTVVHGVYWLAIGH